MKERTLVRDLIIALTITTGVVTTLVGSGLYLYFVSTTRQSVKNSATGTIEKFAEIISLPLWEINTNEIHQIAQAYLDHDDVEGLRILDEQGTVVFEEHKPNFHPIFEEERKIRYQDIVIGTTEFAFNDHRIAAVQKNILQTVAAISFFVIFAMILAIRILLKKMLHNPLRHMYEGIERIARGRYDYRLQSVPQIDIDEIAQTVNRMAEAIQVREQKLQNAQKELERKVAERTADLQKANENLKREIAQKEAAEKRVWQYNQKLLKTNKELEEFTYVATHDLQEPLRTLISYCELLQVELGEDLSDEARESIEFIIEASLRMKRLITDLLALSRAGRQEIKPSLVDLNRCLESVVGELKRQVEETGAFIEWDPLPVVQGDPLHLSRVFQNLLSNSLKFRGEEPPRVRVTARERDHQWEIEVSDNGIGIQEAYWEQIFAPFKRLHTSRDYDGSGIGLAICKKIIERHNGSIAVQSHLGKGSTFIITLKK